MFYFQISEIFTFFISKQDSHLCISEGLTYFNGDYIKNKLSKWPLLLEYVWHYAIIGNTPWGTWTMYVLMLLT